MVKYKEMLSKMYINNKDGLLLVEKYIAMAEKGLNDKNITAGVEFPDTIAEIEGVRYDSTEMENAVRDIIITDDTFDWTLLPSKPVKSHSRLNLKVNDIENRLMHRNKYGKIYESIIRKTTDNFYSVRDMYHKCDALIKNANSEYTRWSNNFAGDAEYMQAALENAEARVSYLTDLKEQLKILAEILRHDIEIA